MNNKLRIFYSMLLAATLITVQASAAVLDELVAEYSPSQKAVTVSAAVDNSVGDKAGEIVVKLVGGKDAQLDTDSALLVAADVITVGDKDTMVHRIGLKPELAEGRYNVYLSGSGIVPVDTSFWYYTDTTIASKTQLVAGAASTDMKKVLFEDKLIDGEYYDMADELSLKNSFYAQSSDSIIARIVANEASGITDWNDLKEVFNTACVIAALESNNLALVTDENYNFKAELFADENPASKIQLIYEGADSITKIGKQQMLNMLSGKSWNKVADFEKDLAKHVLYAAVYNATTEGYGHIPQLISDMAVFAGYNATAFNALSADNKLAVASTVLLSNASTPEAMLTAVDTAISGLGDSNGGGSSGGGNTGGGNIGGGGGQAIGISGGYADELKGQSNAHENAYMNGFADLTGYEWAKDAITYLADNGIVSGAGNGKYLPSRSITREEFAKMLTLVMGYETTGSAGEFSDVLSGTWYEPYIAALASKGITQGVGNGKFGIGTPITRQECCTLIYRALGGEGGSAAKFSDDSSIAEWAVQAVGAMSEKGIIKGYEDGSFKPENNITRAEAAVVFYRMIKGGAVG